MSTTLLSTPFHDLHLKAGASMVDFGGWHMPVRYVGDKKEHLAVREKVGLFDVSHMGEIEIKGKGSLELLQYLTCNDVSQLQDGQIHYNVLMSPKGGFLDDLLIYRRATEDYFVVVNASHQEKDFEWITKQNEPFGAEVHFASHDYAQLAVQGPKAVDVLEKITEIPVRTMKYYWFTEGECLGVPAIISRTGYTGSDGYEIYFAPEHAEKIWNEILAVGEPHGILPCGLGARDSLRLEGKMLLCGTDVNDQITPLEAGLSWIVKLEKGDFVGREILQRQKEEGVSKKLIGFEMLEKGIPRHDYPIIKENQEVGIVTSGTLSITFNKAIGLGYVPPQFAKIGSQFEVQIRQRRALAQVVKTPFYKIERTS